MTPERSQKIKELYQAARQREEGDRAAYLQQACAGDDGLRQEVESLLAQGSAPGNFLKDSASKLAPKAFVEVQHASLVGRRLGVYQVLSPLGAGGMGEVYKARDTKLGRDVAIKVLPPVYVHDPEWVARFEREARLLAALNHPNIATIHGLEQSEGAHYLVMELVPGETLAERLRQGPLGIEQALRIGSQIAEALEAAHEKGVMHRDLKPANVKVTPEGRVKVLDFGLAKAYAAEGAQDISQAATLTALPTEEGKILGTPAYMSPEQARGKPVDKRTDIWAFGCVFYELLTGKRLFRGESLTDTVAAVLEREPEWQKLPPATPAKIRDLLRRCLQKEASRRLRDIGDARIEIEEALLAPAVTVPTSSATIPSGARNFWQTRWAPVAVLVAVAILSAGIGFWFRQPVRNEGSVTRLTITLPKSQQLASLETHSVAISPDGTNLVYAASEQGVSQLYLRPIGSLEARVIPGTESASAPFFSSDGHWIGFFAGAKLKKIPVGGGPAITLCDSPTNQGGDWGPDGRIYFTPQEISGIWRVSADGGTPEPVTTLDRQEGETAHIWPQILPGGKAVLFTVWTGPGLDENYLEIQALGTSRHRILLRGSGGGYYSPSGHLVYVRGGVLMAVPFDLARLEVTSDAPVELTKGVLEGAVAPHFSISTGGTLAYVPGPSMVVGETRLVWVDRRGGVEPLSAPPRIYRNLGLSHDGRRVAIGTLGAKGDIWIYDLARTTFTRLTSEMSTLFPLWAPDDSRVIYQAFRQGSRDLYWRRTDGTGSDELLAASQGEKWPSSWTPDGKILAFQEQGPSTGWDIWVVDAAGDRKPRPLLQTPFNERYPQISPDGRWMAYTSDESGRGEVYVQPFPGLGRKWQISTEGGTLSTWARSGKELFYLNGKKMMVAEIQTQPEFAAGTPRLLFEGDYFYWAGRSYDVSPDGQRFLMLQLADQGQGPTQINIVLNWFDELKRLVPAKK